MQSLSAYHDWLRSKLWPERATPVHPALRIPLRVFQTVYVVVRDLSEGQITLRAMSLVYTSLLSLVPLLAVSFSVLKAFGVHNQFEPFLLQFLEPLGPKGTEISNRIIEFVENIRVGVLGSVGLVLLFYTVISLIQKIEYAFNFIWRVPHSRGLAQRFSDYLSVILIGPVLMFTALGITASIMSATVVRELAAIEPFGTLIELAGQLIPYALVIAAFTFIYIAVPHTRVRLAAGLVGGVVAGVLWETAGWGFAFFAVASTKYAAIYSSFAILIMFMIWVYLSWIILLVGAQVSFYVQNPRFLTPHRKEFRLSNDLKERLALTVMALVGRSHYYDQPRWTAESLAEHLGFPVELIARVVGILENGGFIVESCDRERGYVPAHDIETIKLTVLLDVVRRDGDESVPGRGMAVSLPEVDATSERIVQAVDATLAQETVKSLVLAEGAEVVSGPAEERTVSDRARS
jgi:membrane protein